MRTALVFSALLIADAIRIVEYPDDIQTIMAKLIIIFIVVDIAEFLSNLSKRSN